MPESAVAEKPLPPVSNVIPFAVVAGEPYDKLPDDLYIPPDALRIILETFEGPLDLLLYLIKRQNIEITELPVAKITKQYVEYIELMQSLELELAADYLVMAATLAEIKSRMLLPRSQEAEQEEDDPRAELIRRLQEYERFKKAAEDLDTLPRQGRDTFPVNIELPEFSQKIPLPETDLESLLAAFRAVLNRAELRSSHQVTREPLSIRQRMTEVLDLLQSQRITTFVKLFHRKEGRMGVAVTFIAILELTKQSLISIVQTEPFSPIHITLVDNHE